MAISNGLKNQIQNKNFLSPVGFKFILNRTPKVAFFSNSAVIPGFSLGTAVQPTYLKDIDLPGDKLTFNDFSLRFLVDEDLENYNEIQKWMRGMGFPESLEEIYKFQKSDPNAPQDNKRLNLYSDGTLNVLKACVDNKVRRLIFTSSSADSISVQSSAGIQGASKFGHSVNLKFQG